MLHVKAEIEKLKESLRRLEEIDESRTELNNLEMELQWAIVSSSMKALEILQVFPFEIRFYF